MARWRVQGDMLRSLVVLAAIAPDLAYACGCFTPPDPTVPVVQAGEKILFAVKDGEVTAHVQVQYAGNGGEFGWLLPLPAGPGLELGVDELFTAGTDQSVLPYIRTGAFFLALKLRSGQTTGDLQPVVLRYASDVGMIPITLTSTGAEENMAVQVWMLGSGRAIPRNYRHTVLNDAVIDWRTAGSNYQSVIIRAAGEAPAKQTFVTEYAGSSSVMRDRLAPPA